MSRTKNGIDVRIGEKIMVGVMRLLALQPLKVHYFYGRVMSWFAMKVLHYRNDVVMINLARSFPEKKYKELVKICKDFYRHFGNLFVETLWFAGAHNRKRLRDSHICELENSEVLNRLYAESPSILCLTSHLGNWEISGGIMNYAYAPEHLDFDESRVTVVYKKLSNKFWDNVMGVNRCAAIAPENASVCYVESRQVLRFAIQHKAEKRMYVFPTDQCPYKYAQPHKIGSFLNQETLTMTGGAALACKFKYSVVYLAIKEKEDFGYKMEFKEICADASQTTPEAIMEKFYEYLEEDVKAQPANYLWTHKRWKK